MAEYKSAYTGEEIDSGIAKANTAYQDLSGKQETLVSGENIKTINNKSILGSGNIDASGDNDYIEKIIVDGYSEFNGTQSNTFFPFIADKKVANGVIITKIKINIARIGVLSIGTIESQYISGNRLQNAVVTETITFTETGEQTITLTNPITMNGSKYLFVGYTGDDVLFYYGANGVNKGFYYGANFRSNNSLGIGFYGEVLENPRPYRNKKISILGDSISTFEGYIPSGNATYYPAGSVTEVTDTWWDKLIEALGMQLDINNSWSGSRVTTTAGDESAGCMTRCENLGTNPDVIIVYMGINDFNNEVPLGTYDGTTSIPETTTTFREAYAIMLNKILTKYQTSEVWVCTLPQCERNGSTGFPEVNQNDVPLFDFNKAIVELANAFGVKILDHNKCGLNYQNMPTYNTDKLHPNKYGHSLMANNAIRTLDSAVKKRYDIG